MIPHLIGTDEAGCGTAAGPLVAAAVVWPDPGQFDGLTDSKKMTPRKRERMCWLIMDQAPFWVAAFASSAQVDLHGVHEVRFALMEKAAEQCRSVCGDLPIVVDGDRNLPLTNCRAEVEADLNVPAVSAASVIAKVLRDKYMVLIDEKYPGYGFANHKGYVTKAHRAQLMELGPCLEHRRSYAPVQEALGNPT